MSDQREPGKFDLAPELVALQSKLAQLAPTPPRIDRDQLMYSAGRAAALALKASRVVLDPETTTANRCATGLARLSSPKSASARYGWPAATLTMSAATILLSAMLLWQQPAQPIAQDAANPKSNAVAQFAKLPHERISSQLWTPQPTAGYLGVRNVALTRGVGTLAVEIDGTAPPASSSNQPATARQLLEELLPDATRQRS